MSLNYSFREFRFQGNKKGPPKNNLQVLVRFRSPAR